MAADPIRNPPPTFAVSNSRTYLRCPIPSEIRSAFITGLLGHTLPTLPTVGIAPPRPRPFTPALHRCGPVVTRLLTVDCPRYRTHPGCLPPPVIPPRSRTLPVCCPFACLPHVRFHYDCGFVAYPALPLYVPGSTGAPTVACRTWFTANTYATVGCRSPGCHGSHAVLDYHEPTPTVTCAPHDSYRFHPFGHTFGLHTHTTTHYMRFHLPRVIVTLHHTHIWTICVYGLPTYRYNYPTFFAVGHVMYLRPLETHTPLQRSSRCY